ncbi:uncharacterized protein NDAI_0H01590 [Naumovozyma dairenensis CBS 421]|uniref:Uncharacterized protein n=1 Tax=Naumovozyma dairenensis (strain ATCC 10597 / BCRC 20456 / CBS 421 / NBRC 0211 / NRRL Y-12639) TaxID=1071378 RepID=G0WEX2_NAUDC|nr:hypothetical protein NDAI_0H01590 [Naumovozyma dairenensis CBS 421]CCD26333.1 hypothetical protein NDAI_0H01590 [Naumovozyma dairenensis CBS 421]
MSEDNIKKDDNEVLSWYLRNLREGRFENIIEDRAKNYHLNTILDRQLFDNKQYGATNKILVSTLTSIDEIVSIKDIFLGQLFDHERLQYIEVEELKSLKGDNKETHYFLTDHLNSFNDLLLEEERLQTYSTNHSQHYFHRAMKNEKKKKKRKKKKTLVRHLVLMRRNKRTMKKQMPYSLIFESRLRQSNRISKLGHQYTPYHSDSISINSFGSQNDESFSHATSLTRVKCNEHIEEGSSEFSKSLNSLSTDFPSSIEKSEFEKKEEGDKILMDYEEALSVPVVPSISCHHPYGQIRFVLQSIVFKSVRTAELLTAIRQSSADRIVATSSDEWLLYDSDFSLNNLEISTLQDILYPNYENPRILFYTMSVVS